MARLLGVDSEVLRGHLFSGKTPPEISVLMNLSETSAYRYIRNLGLSDDEMRVILVARRQRTSKGVPARLAGNNSAIEEIRRSLESRETDVSAMDGMSTAEKGFIGEQFVKYALARRGIKCAEPAYYGDDLLVLGKDGSWKRCEIKTTVSNPEIIVHRTRKRNGINISRPYDGIDFFILVSLKDENIFVVPFEDVKPGTMRITCSPFGWGWKYRYRTDLF